METHPLLGNRWKSWHPALALLLAYVATRAFSAAIGFGYNLFSEPFDVGKLAIDLGMWLVAYAASLWILNRRAA